MPVTITNTTGTSADIRASVQSSGPLTIIGAWRNSAEVPAGSEGRVVFTVAAGKAINTGKVNVTVQGLGETFTDETDISVRPASTLQKMTGSGSVDEGNHGVHSISIGTGQISCPAAADYRLPR